VFILKHIVILYPSSLCENASKMTRHSCFTLKMILQALEFVQTTCFGIRVTLGYSFIPKCIVTVYTSSFYENASKTTRESRFMLESIVQTKEFVLTTCFRICATLDCLFFLKHVVIIYTSYFYENVSKTTRHSSLTLESIIQA